MSYTYEQLKNRAESRVENAFSDDDFQMFVRLAERKIYDTVQSLAQRSNRTSALNPQDQFLTVPSDWLYTHSLAVIDTAGNYNYLLRKDVNFIREAYPNPTTYAQPKYFGDFDETTLILGPTPDIGYQVQLHYASYPASMIDAPSQTSWLSENGFNALLAQVIVQCGINLKFEQDIMKVYADEYVQAISELKMLVDGFQEQQSYRNGFSRIQTV